MDASSASQQEDAGPSALKTPQMDQSEWASASTPTSSTPSRQAFPKPLSLGSQSVASSSTTPGPPSSETPRRGKRSSISYIASPATSVKADEGLSRAPSTSSASGRTRTGSISRATSGSLRRKPSQASQGHGGGTSSDADDWLMSEEDASFSLPSKSMAERDSAKVEALFNDTGYREGITAGKLSTLQSGFDQGFNESGPRTTRLSLSSDDSLPTTSHDLLRLIAEKERHCFELREQLATSEAQLHQLRTTWQRLATRELAYTAPPPTGAHRRDGSASSTSDVAVDAWNSLSSRLPGSLKTQLNNLLDSLVDAPAAAAAAAEKGRKPAPPPVAVDGMLRPTGLGVLEEEGSDVVSPRSPRSPAVGARSRSTSPNTTITSAPSASLADRDSRALGFTVDANGIATPLPIAPTKNRTSLLGSLTGADRAGESSFASMFAKRLQAARENASDLLREAERKLGNAMTIEELKPKGAPGIQVEEASNDSSWYKAAGGGASRRSPNLQPTRTEEDGVSRASFSSGSSDGKGRTASPVLGGMPGAVGVFGMLMGQGERERRKSGDSWSWGGGGEDEEWEKGKDARNGSGR